MSAEPVPSSAELISLDELTERVGISVRNIRFYTTRGLLPPPLRRGRSGYYSRDHIARLELVKELQAHGFTLAAIEKYVARIPADATPEEIALHRVTLQPFLVEQPMVLSRGGLAKRAGRPITDQDLEKLMALGVVAEVDGRYQVLERQLASAVRLVELDVPANLILACEEVYQRHGKAIAEELGVLFRETFWPAYKGGMVTTEQMVAMLDNFQQVSIASLVEAFSQAMTEARRAEVEKRAR
jgi:DNA-binding transcriptional MerR regulator